MLKLMKSRKGFTLVEIIVVLVIIAILAAAAIPAMIGFIQQSRDKACLSEARTALVAAAGVASERVALGLAVDATDILGDANFDAMTIELKGSVTDVTADADSGQITDLVFENADGTIIWTFDNSTTNGWTVSH